MLLPLPPLSQHTSILIVNHYYYKAVWPVKMAYNWDLFVCGPEFAMLNTPRPVCVRFGLNSSLKASPQIDLPPWPVPSGSPPCIWKWQWHTHTPMARSTQFLRLTTPAQIPSWMADLHACHLQPLTMPATGWSHWAFTTLTTKLLH